VTCIAALWHWRTHRGWRAGSCAIAAAALSAWFHPLSGLYAALAWLFIFLEDVAAPRAATPRPSRKSLALGAGIGLASLVLLAPPLVHDRQSLAAKAGGDQPDLATYERMLSIFWGGLPDAVTVLACVAAAWGAFVLLRRDRRLGAYLLVLTLGPPAVVTLLGALYVQQGQNLGRYVLPMQPLLLFLGSVGAIDAVRRLARDRGTPAAWIAAATLSALYVAATPTVVQVATLGPWYAHLDYHWDYRVRGNAAKRAYRSYDPPAFYRTLGRMAPGTVTIIEAPFEWRAPYDPLAYYATYHRQRELFGMLDGFCRERDPPGEPLARDRRFRFRLFVFLDDVDAVRNSGARYLLLDRGGPHDAPFPEADRCIAKLSALYGSPIADDARLAVFDLHPEKPALLPTP
jgi:hypothetical protein